MEIFTYIFCLTFAIGKNAVNSTRNLKSSGFDHPEGGFDALLQAMVCREQIGWRERSRRLIVFATDAFSHLAGNGKVKIIVMCKMQLCLM